MTEMSVILAGSAKDFRCLAARSDCWLPSVATTTCISGPPRPGDGCVVFAGLRTARPAEEVLDEEQHDADGGTSPAHQYRDVGSS